MLPGRSPSQQPIKELIVAAADLHAKARITCDAVRHITDLSDEGGRRYRIDIEQTGTMAHSIEVGIHDSAGGLHLMETKGTGPIEIELG